MHTNYRIVKKWNFRSGEFTKKQVSSHSFEKFKEVLINESIVDSELSIIRLCYSSVNGEDVSIYPSSFISSFKVAIKHYWEIDPRFLNVFEGEVTLYVYQFFDRDFAKAFLFMLD